MIQVKNFAQVLVFSCFILVSKLVSPEHTIKLRELSIKYEVNLEVTNAIESYILNRVGWKLHLSTPESLAIDLVNLLFSKNNNEKKNDLIFEFNKTFIFIISNFDSYKKYNQYAWTLAILQRSLIINELTEESRDLLIIAVNLIKSQQESEYLADCFDLLTLLLDQSGVENCCLEKEEINLKEVENLCLDISPCLSDCLVEYGECHLGLNIDVLEKFNCKSKHESIHNNEYSSTGNYHTVTKASEKDNYDSTGSMTVIKISPFTKLDYGINLNLSDCSWNVCHEDSDEDDLSSNELHKSTKYISTTESKYKN